MRHSERLERIPPYLFAELERKIAAIDASGADRVVSCDLGCLMQIGGGLHRRGSRVRAQHLAQFLDEALP